MNTNIMMFEDTHVQLMSKQQQTSFFTLEEFSKENFSAEFSCVVFMLLSCVLSMKEPKEQIRSMRSLFGYDFDLKFFFYQIGRH